MDVWLQQYNPFRTIEQCGNDDRTENAKLCLSVHLLLLPKDATETANSLRGFADPGADHLVRATVLLNDTSQVLETRDRFNRGLVLEKVNGNRLCTKTGLKNCHGLGL